MNPGARAEAQFRDAFGDAAVSCASAPGRINIIGEHVDYHGGKVLPCATTERTAVAVGPAKGLRGVSEQAAPVQEPWPPKPTGAWSDYCAGVALELGNGPWNESGLAIAVASDVPVGAGLSSSAALGVATALALANWAGRRMTPRQVVDLVWRAESTFVGIPCGIMDQTASAMAPESAALLLDCGTMAMESVPAPIDLVVAQSGESHALRDSAYADRRREGEAALAILRREMPSLKWLVDLPPARLQTAVAALPDSMARRVRHVVNENQRTVLAAAALRAGDLEALGMLVNASHDSLRDLYECSTERIDAIVTAARALPRVLGARIVGGGWGGSVLIVTPPGAGGAVAAELARSKLNLPDVRVIKPGVGATQ